MVETTGFRRIDQRNAGVFGTSERGRVIERFTPTGAGSMDYTITVDDPAIYTRSWTASIPMSKVEGPLYEYACHEGNYGLRGIMAGPSQGRGRKSERRRRPAALKELQGQGHQFGGMVRRADRHDDVLAALKRYVIGEPVVPAPRSHARPAVPADVRGPPAVAAPPQ